ncbi:hypothetical protein [Mucilaginibacter sp. FT3.2]|uniref:hypothetical protein n=1 Tax=Mucilaginibacter sp. FT3.2 TaxID=2723090 RepID=UPI001607C73A|nr:hypothetical protein [Mucilaginibacter sp. FT3.2]MBB6234955.1 chromosome segregation ATPase [Mucilaginibacter sp. FT3.2]
MKKLLFIWLMLFGAFHSKAETNLKPDTVKKDSVKINKLNVKLNDLKAKLGDIQKQLPIDSLKLENTLGKSHDAQVKSRKRSEQAVGGDLDDAKLAAKEAKKAAKQTQEADDASRQMERDRKKVKDLLKQIKKAQEKLDKAQAVE